MKLENNGKISHFNWDNLVTNAFGLAGKFVDSGSANTTTVIYKQPQIPVNSTDTEKILMWAGIGVAVLILAVVLIVIFKK